MNYSYEFVKYDKNIPGRILMQDKPGWRCNTMPHWHPELEFVYMIDGTLKVTQNGQSQTIHSGEFYFCNTKTIHWTATPDNTSNYKYIVVMLSYDYLLRFHEDCVFDILQGEAYERIKQQLQRLVELETEPAGRETFYIDIEKNKSFLEIYQILLSECIVDNTKASQSTVAIHGYAKTIMEYVRKNYQQPLTLPHVADVVGLSPQYLSKYFKKATGFGINYYINLIRLEYANDDLLNDNSTVVEAALNNGFANVKSYVKFCKEVYGMTPTEYRKAVRSTGK